MNKKISETRLKDSLEGLKKDLEDQINKKNCEQKTLIQSLESKHHNKISELEDELQIEIGIIKNLFLL